MKITTMFLTALLWAPLWAAPLPSLEVGLSSDNIYRGEDITTEDLTFSGTLRVDDVLLPGVFVRVAADSHNSTASGNTRLRVQGGAGFAAVWRDVELQGSLDRVFEPALQEQDYNQATVAFQTNWRLLGYVDFDGSVSRALSGTEHWYITAGTTARDVLIPGLDLSLSVGFYQYATSDNWEFDRNLWQLGAAYRLTDSVSVYVTHSLGNVGFAAQQLDDHTVVGIRFSL